MQPDFLAGKTVLVADDEKFCRQIVLRHLCDYGEPRLSQAQNGAEALAILADPGKSCDAVIVDFSMPMVNGLSVLKAIRVGFNNIRRDLPVLMLTGNSDAALVSSALLLDVDAFVVKPVSKAVLSARLFKALSEPRTVGPVSAYSRISTEEQERKAIAAPVPMALQLGTEFSLSDVQPHSVLARDLRNSADAIVLAAGTRLSERYILRLRELAALDLALRKVWLV